VPHNEHERIQIAVAQTIATRGYESTSVHDICAAAHISSRIFYEHFAGKQDAALSTLEAGMDRVMADCRAVFRAAPNWPEAIWATFEVYAEWIAGEPAFARLALVELFAAGEPALELLQSLMDALAIFLKPGYVFLKSEHDRATTDASPQRSQQLLDEMVGNAVFGLLHAHITRESPETVAKIVPELVRQILTPFLGAQEAAEAIERRRLPPAP
jgi:AcrR family transcriptional regulator